MSLFVLIVPSFLDIFWHCYRELYCFCLFFILTICALLSFHYAYHFIRCKYLMSCFSFSPYCPMSILGRKIMINVHIIFIHKAHIYLSLVVLSISVTCPCSMYRLILCVYLSICLSINLLTDLYIYLIIIQFNSLLHLVL